MEGEILPKNKGGRPSKYDPSFCDTIIELAYEGAGILQMMVDEQAFNRIAREGQKGDTKALQWSLYNKCPELYSMPNGKGTEITINGGNVILSTSEIDNQIEAVKAQLRSLNDIPDAEERLLRDK